MSFFIVIDGNVITLNKDISESKPLFIQRVEFLIYALNKGYNLQQSNTLSMAYRNRQQFGVTYPDDVEKKINEIINTVK